MPEPQYYGSEYTFPFKELIQASSTLFYHRKIDDNFPFVYISSNVNDILGFAEKKFKTDEKLWFDRVHKDDRDRVLSLLESLSEKGQAVIEYRFKHKEGHYIWLREEIKLVTADPDKADTIVGLSVEVTEEKKAEAKLRKLNKTLEERIRERTSKLATANRKLKKQVQYQNKTEVQLKEQHEKFQIQQMAIDNLNDMVVVTKAPKDDPLNSEIIFVNTAFEKFTGYQAQEVIGRQPTFLHGPKTSPKVLEKVNKQILNHESLREEFINYKKDGSTYWVELDMAPFPTDDDKFEYWVGINRDITQRKKAEQKLEESEQRYRAFAELSFDAIFEVALDGTILDCNKRATELFGYSREDLIGMNTLELTPEEYHNSQPNVISKEATTGDEAWERTYLKKDGTHFPTEIHTQLYTIGGQKRLIAYVRDNTAHKNYENTIRQSLKEKETLLAEVHHRVKNNLAIISGLLEMQVFNTEDEQLLAKLKESQSRIKSIAMVHEKLYSSESFSEIAIDTYINDLLKMVVDSIINFDKEIHIKKDMDSIVLTVGQAIPCGLLLNELITNAYKHAFNNRDEGIISISLKKEGTQVILKVADNGDGLPDNFDIETQSSLGMTLVTTLTKQLGGQLDVSSGDGACFQVTFEIEEES